jgi:hypothetical protein
MWRGTTPTNVFTFPEEYRDISFETIFVTYSQGGKTVLEKAKNEISFTDTGISIALAQADTLCFSPGTVKIQIRAKTSSGKAVASNVISTTAQEILKDGEI